MKVALETTKTCRTCETTKGVGEFYARRRVCKACLLTHRRAYIRAHPEEHSRRTRDWQKRNPDKVLDGKLRREYGIGLTEYNAMTSAQGGVCAICEGAQTDGRRLYVDHCHTTGRVRGLLCHNCNLTLGLMADQPQRLIRAAEYLQGVRA